MATPITQAIQTEVANNYLAILGRNPDPAGFGYWTNALANANNSAAAQQAITLGFSNSPEFVATYGGMTTTQAVTQFYNNILNRAPDANGLAYWSNQVQGYINQGYTIGQSYALAAVSLINVAAANTGTADQTLILNKEQAAITAATAAPSTNYTLSTTNLVYTATNGNGPNNFIGTFDGHTPATGTFIAGDQITGAGVQNTLTLNDSGTAGSAVAALPVLGATVTLTNIQNLVINSAENIKASTTSAPYTSVTNVTVNATDAGGAGSTLTVAAAQTATLVDAELDGQTDAVNGGSAATVSETQTLTGGTLNVGTTTAVGSGAIVVTDTVNLGGITGAAINTIGGSSVTINDVVGSGVKVNTTATFGAIGVTGTAATTAVTVTQAAAATASATVVGVANGAVTINDLNAASATKANTIATVSLTNVAGATVNSEALTSLSVSGVTGNNAIAIGNNGGLPTAATTLTLNLNGVARDSKLAAATAFNDANVYTTVNIVTGANASNITFADTALTTLNVSGTGALQIATATSATSIVDTATGVQTFTLAAGQAFNGTGSGQDIITISALPSAAITASVGTASEIVARFNGTGVTNLGVTNFTTLGFNTNTQGTFALGSLTGFTALDVQALGGNTTVTGATGQALSFTGNTGGNTFTYTAADKTGASDSLTVTVGKTSSTGTGFTVNTLTANDAAGVAIANVTINSIANTNGYTNVFTNLDTGATASNISALTITGNAGLTATIGNAANTTGALTITNNGTTVATDIIGYTGSALASVVFAGTVTNATTLNITDTGYVGAFSLSNTSAGALTGSSINDLNMTSLALGGSAAIAETITGAAGLSISNSDSAAVTLTSVTDAGALTLSSSSAALETVKGLTTVTNLTVSDSGNGGFALGTNAANLSIAGNLALGNTGTGTITSFITDTVATATTVSITGTGAEVLTLTDVTHFLALTQTGNANVTLTLNGMTGDSVVLGNGTNTVTIVDATVTDTYAVTVGTGTNSVTYAAHTAHTAVDTLAIGANGGSASVLTTATGMLGHVTTATADGDTVTFAGTFATTVVGALTGDTSAAAFALHAQASYVAATGTQAFTETIGSNTYVYQATGTVANDTMVSLVGTHTIAAALSHVATLAS